MDQHEEGTKRGLADTEAQHTEVHIDVEYSDMLLGSLAVVARLVADIGYTGEHSTLGCHTVVQVQVQGLHRPADHDYTLEVLPTVHTNGLKEVDTQPAEDDGKMEPVVQVRGIAGTEEPGELWLGMIASLDSECRLGGLAMVHLEMNCHLVLQLHLGSLDERLALELGH